MLKLISGILVFLSLSIFAENFIMFGPPLAVTVTNTSTQILPQNSLRTYLILVNTGTNTAYVKMGSVQSTSTEGVPIPAGGNYEPFQAPANSVFVVSPSGSFLTVIQGQ